MSGYIQIEINSKAVGLKYNMYAMEIISGVNGDKGKAGSYANVVNLVWAGYAGNCFAKQTEPELSFEEISEWAEEIILDGDAENVASKIVDAFTSSKAYQKLLTKGEQQPEEDSKKNSQQIGNESMSLSLVKSA